MAEQSCSVMLYVIEKELPRDRVNEPGNRVTD